MTDATPRTFAVTCAVPEGAGKRLRVEVEGRTVTAASSDGFTHVFELPPGVAAELLRWQVYADVLELRAPYQAVFTRTRGANFHDP